MKEEKPEKARPAGAEPQKAEKAKETGPPDRQRELMSELEDSLMRGLISRKAYEKAKKLIPGGSNAPTKKSDRK